jgi:Amidase
MNDRAFASATELTNEIRDRRIGCVELLDFYLARAERHNPTLNAIIVWQIDQARERARAADDALARGERWGPLHGIPMTVKESFNVAGLPTTFGNPLWKDNIAADNAFLIDRLLQAGAIVFGKTNVPYMLADAQSYNDIYGTTNNPWDLTRSPGGSSGGEAAPRRRAVGPRCRQRHCGLLAQPGALQRHLWPQTDLGAESVSLSKLRSATDWRPRQASGLCSAARLVIHWVPCRDREASSCTHATPQNASKS